MDLAKDRERSLSQGNNYDQRPTVSGNGIVAYLEKMHDGEYSSGKGIVVVDAHNGKELHRIQAVSSQS